MFIIVLRNKTIVFRNVQCNTDLTSLPTEAEQGNMFHLHNSNQFKCIIHYYEQVYVKVKKLLQTIAITPF